MHTRRSALVRLQRRRRKIETQPFWVVVFQHAACCFSPAQGVFPHADKHPSLQAVFCPQSVPRQILPHPFVIRLQTDFSFDLCRMQGLCESV